MATGNEKRASFREVEGRFRLEINMVRMFGAREKNEPERTKVRLDTIAPKVVFNV